MAIKAPRNVEPRITLREALQNPSGAGSAAVGNRKVIKDNLRMRYTKEVYPRGIDYKIYNEGDNFVLHFRIPSENYDIHFDVVLRIIPVDGATNVRDWEVEFFSNIPAFTFTYAYAIYHKGWLISQLADRFSDVALTETPRVKNPLEENGFEKSIYYALLFMENFHLFSSANLKRLGKEKVDWKKLSTSIDTDSGIMKKYNAVKKKASAEKKARKEKEARANNAANAKLRKARADKKTARAKK